MHMAAVKDKPIDEAAREIAAAGRRCSESALRRLERKGIVKPARDPWGRRLFGADDIEAARKHLAAQQPTQAVA
jgi:DNA-binding transcriptional MerR regulator